MTKITIELEEDAFGNLDLLRKLKPGEPYFILRAQDKLGASTVRFWANEAERIGINDAKVANARKCAHAILQWTPKKMPD